MYIENVFSKFAVLPKWHTSITCVYHLLTDTCTSQTQRNIRSYEHYR